MAKKDTKAQLAEAYDEVKNGTDLQSRAMTSAAAQTDVTKQPQAMTNEDVNNQDSRTRLWQSLKTNYDAQVEESNKAYDQNYSQAETAALKRGMGRSSYNLQTLANISTEKAKAANRLGENLIASYQSGLNTLEQQEKEDERWNQQFAYQKERDTVADRQWQQQFDAQKDQWKQEFEYNKMSASQQLAYNYLMNMLETNDNPSDALLKQAGISRADYQQMKATVKKTGGGGGGRRNNNPSNTNNGSSDIDTNTPGAAGSTLDAVNNYFNNTSSYTPTVTVTQNTTNTTNKKDDSRLRTKFA